MGATLMSDQEILLALEDKVLQIEPLSDEDKILHRKNASIQPSSVDLRIGRILLPDSGGGQKETQVASRWRLEPGNSAVIETRETITLSAQISGFGFPPAHLAAKGLLVTNPGHVDPGFAGTLRLTVINMGRNEILLEEGGEIISLLLLGLRRMVSRFTPTILSDVNPMVSLPEVTGTRSAYCPQILVISINVLKNPRCVLR